jgi:hypothetical protein
MQAIDDISTITEENESSAGFFSPTGKAPQVTCASRRRPMDTSEYALAHGTLYRLGPKTSKRARKQATQCM